MKRLILVIITLTFFFACKKDKSEVSENNIQMSMDSLPSGEFIIPGTRDTLRPAETIADLKELPNVMQLDLDTSRTSSKEVIYVRLGEDVRPTESK